MAGMGVSYSTAWCAMMSVMMSVAGQSPQRNISGHTALGVIVVGISYVGASVDA